MYMKALQSTQSILTNTLRQLHQVYLKYVLLPETQHWTKGGGGLIERAAASAAAERASAAVTAWILHSSLGWPTSVLQ